MDFRKVLARIYFLQEVAELLKVDQNTLANDAENALLSDHDAKQQENQEGLLTTQTALRIVGGTVKQSDVQTLKKLIFRGTRGKALVQTFDLNLDISDVLNNKSFNFDAMDGYVVIFDDTTNLGRTIMRICNSFQSDLYETSL